MKTKKRAGDIDWPLVLVHLGDSLPWYLRRNINYLVSCGFQLKFVSDDEKICTKLRQQGIDSYLFTDANKIIEKLQTLLNHNPRFRDGFWLKAIVRFYAILDFMNSKQLEFAVHIESDVWISPRFPFDKLFTYVKGIGYPLSAVKFAIPSVFVVGNRGTLRNFIEFAEMEMKKNAESTDMSILFRYFVSYPDKVKILPTIPESVETLNPITPKSYSSLLVDSGEFKGIFDANTWGQYFFGWDPRNEKGRRILFREYPEHFVIPKNFRISLNGSQLTLKKNYSETELFNLHIHSKDSRIFIPKLMRLLVILRNVQEKKGMRIQKTHYMIVRKVIALKVSAKRNLFVR